jgi:zinc/manganese transport system permease protein
VVGVLLIFSLLVLPAAIAERVCRTPARAIALCVAISLVLVWSALSIAYYSQFRVGFLISGMAFAAYAATRLVYRSA